ncbi:RNA polymerase sigma factor [Microlunatus ginsengisoli]|uniref:Sigma-70 family RNA polymerase sigma factor n=1 Tax=Microlunatus ginsengisoli TaxID=363863 RepID=A0ABP7A9V0_9ACTN
MDDIAGTECQTATEGYEAPAECDWDALVAEFQPLISSVCRHFRLGPEDSADISQEVWLKAFTHIHTLRDPHALPGWLKTTAYHAACSLVDHKRRTTLLADPDVLETSSWTAVDAEVDADLLHHERVAAVRTGLAELPERSQELVSLLVADPPIRYEEISVLMDMPVGSIGPTRARCLSKLAGTAPVRALLESAA